MRSPGCNLQSRWRRCVFVVSHRAGTCGPRASDAHEGNQTRECVGAAAGTNPTRRVRLIQSNSELERGEPVTVQLTHPTHAATAPVRVSHEGQREPQQMRLSTKLHKTATEAQQLLQPLARHPADAAATPTEAQQPLQPPAQRHSDRPGTPVDPTVNDEDRADRGEHRAAPRAAAAPRGSGSTRGSGPGTATYLEGARAQDTSK